MRGAYGEGPVTYIPPDQMEYDSMSQQYTQADIPAMPRLQAPPAPMPPSPKASPARKSHYSLSGGTQNQGNVLGDRSCVRQSKLYRQYESGNSMKAIFG